MTDQTDPETLKRLERAVRKLPRLQREIFLAARLDDMDYVEIVERTGLSIREVERHIAKALLASSAAWTSNPGAGAVDDRDLAELRPGEVCALSGAG